MRSSSLFASFALVLFFILNIPHFVFAASAEKPLMIIRFSEDSVNYEQSLGKAIKMALDKKPTVIFDLVAISPETRDSAANKQNKNDIKFLVEKIADQIKQSGVSADKIKVTFSSNKLINNNEIQIFVQ